MSEWISVEERLPEASSGTESVNVLSHSEECGACEAFYCHNDEEWYSAQGEMIDPYGDNPVTHWQPLPEPPK